MPPDDLVAEAFTFAEAQELFKNKKGASTYLPPDEIIDDEIPSVPIPPPTKSEHSSIKMLHDSAFITGAKIGVLTPSPEFILAELGTAAPGFG